VGSIDYRASGVDQDRKDAAVEEALRECERTFRPEVIRNPGGFAGLFALGALGAGGRWRDPVLVSGADGVGTKVKLAQVLGRHDTVGIDLVAMSVNDVLVEGAEPLFFLDYIAMGRVEKERVAALVRGVAEGCRRAGCALLGGETAEMPGVYQGDDYDLAGFAVGCVERDAIIDGSTLAPGDVLLGLRSSGVHSNGYSLVRRIFLAGGPAPLSRRPAALGGATLGEALLEPTRIYAGALRALLARLRPRAEVRAIAHVTGAGIEGNLPRVLPPGAAARIRKGSWPIPPIFDIIRSEGQVEEAEMFRVFNMGVGMIVATPAAAADAAVQTLSDAGFAADVIGEVIPGAGEVRIE
jgi:phosphoribosylformylglycinamidine cyclo-ligase